MDKINNPQGNEGGGGGVFEMDSQEGTQNNRVKKHDMACVGEHCKLTQNGASSNGSKQIKRVGEVNTGIQI